MKKREEKKKNDPTWNFPLWTYIEKISTYIFLVHGHPKFGLHMAKGPYAL